MISPSEHIGLVQAKVSKLIRQYKALEKENLRLKTELEINRLQREQNPSRQKEQLRQLQIEQQMNLLKDQQNKLHLQQNLNRQPSPFGRSSR
jgi:hypothetical protein